MRVFIKNLAKTGPKEANSSKNQRKSMKSPPFQQETLPEDILKPQTPPKTLKIPQKTKDTPKKHQETHQINTKTSSNMIKKTQHEQKQVPVQKPYEENRILNNESSRRRGCIHRFPCAADCNREADYDEKEKEIPELDRRMQELQRDYNNRVKKRKKERMLICK